MKIFLRKFSLIVSCICLLSVILIAQSVVLDTIRTTTNEIVYAKSDRASNHFAWFEDSGNGFREYLHLYNGQIDTLFMDPSDICGGTRRSVSVTANSVAWNIGPTNGGSCQTNFTWTDGIGVQPGIWGPYIIDLDCEYAGVSPRGGGWAEGRILDLNAGTLSIIPSQIGLYTYEFRSYDCAITREGIIWITAKKIDSSSGVTLGTAILKFNLLTGGMEEIYSTLNTIYITHTDNPYQLAFMERLSNNSRHIYFYDGLTVNLIVTTYSTGRYSTFNNGIAYKTSFASSTIQHWSAKNGITSTLSTNSERLFPHGQSSCYLAYYKEDNSNSQSSFTVYISNGTNTVNFIVDGELNIVSLIMIENNFTFIAQDYNSGEYHFIHGEHDLSCGVVCPDDDVFVSQGDPSNYLYRKSIESEATIPTPIQTHYRASNYILLSESFTVELGSIFTADINACPW